MGVKTAKRVNAKRASEVRIVNLEFEDDLASAETISTVSSTSITPSTGSLTVDSTAVSGSVVQLTLSGGLGQVAFTAEADDDTLTATSHGLSDGDTIQLIPDEHDSLPAGLSSGVTYYVISSTANTLQVSSYSGGTAVDITEDGNGHLFVQYLVRATCTTSNSQTVIGEGWMQVRD